jgi:hypothetical protein
MVHKRIVDVSPEETESNLYRPLAEAYGGRTRFRCQSVRGTQLSHFSAISSFNPVRILTKCSLDETPIGRLHSPPAPICNTALPPPVSPAESGRRAPRHLDQPMIQYWLPIRLATRRPRVAWLRLPIHPAGTVGA